MIEQTSGYGDSTTAVQAAGITRPPILF